MTALKTGFVALFCLMALVGYGQGEKVAWFSSRDTAVTEGVLVYLTDAGRLRVSREARMVDVLATDLVGDQVFIGNSKKYYIRKRKKAIPEDCIIYFKPNK